MQDATYRTARANFEVRGRARPPGVIFRRRRLCFARSQRIAPRPRSCASNHSVADLNAPDRRAIRPPDALTNDVASAPVAIGIVVIAGVIRSVTVAISIGVSVSGVGPGEPQPETHPDGTKSGSAEAATETAAAKTAAYGCAAEAAAKTTTAKTA